MSTTLKQRPTTPVDLYYMQRMCADPTPWGLAEVETALGLRNRVAVAKLWNNSLNYLQGGLTEWPPSGETLGKRLPITGQQGLAWWPSHVAVLPVPDLPWDGGRPRWTAGCIRKWALEVGRMTWTLDLTPRMPTGRGHRQPKQVVGETPVDLTMVRQLVASEDLWEISDVARFFEVAEVTARHWSRAMVNRWLGGITAWPPSRYESRRVIRAKAATLLDWWPADSRLLPPPAMVRVRDRLVPADEYRESYDGRRRAVTYLWSAGDVARHGLHTGRLRADGTVVQLHPSAA